MIDNFRIPKGPYPHIPNRIGIDIMITTPGDLIWNCIRQGFHACFLCGGLWPPKGSVGGVFHISLGFVVGENLIIWMRFGLLHEYRIAKRNDETHVRFF